MFIVRQYCLACRAFSTELIHPCCALLLVTCLVVFSQNPVTAKPDVLKFDRSDLLTAQNHALKIINFSSPVPNSNSPSPTPTLAAQLTYPPTSSAGFKPPKMEIPKWSGKSYDFYTLISACSRSFEITHCHENYRTEMMIRAMPLEKTPQFTNMYTNWTNFKEKLNSEFGSIPILVWEAHAAFSLLPVYESVQEVAKDSSPKIKNLKSIIECVQEYHPRGILYNTVFTPDLNSNIIRSLPMELRITFNDKYTAFINLDPDNICSPAVFKFLNQYMQT